MNLECYKDMFHYFKILLEEGTINTTFSENCLLNLAINFFTCLRIFLRIQNTGLVTISI